MLIEGVWIMAEVSKVSQSEHSRKSGGTTPPHEKCSVGERLYSHVHVCNHARCAANDPDYNIKSAVPKKKFLAAKKHAYGGLEEKKGEKKRTSNGSSTISPDHQRHGSHAPMSLTNSVLTTESGSNGKVRSNGLRSNVHSVVQNRRATRDKSSISSDPMKVVQRKLRPATTHSPSSVPFGSSSRRSGVTTAESHSTAQKSRLSSAGSIFSSPATEQSKQWEDPASPESSITSIRITQIISTRREDKEEREDETQELVAAAAAASSPTASVGSNHDTEISSLKETVIDFVQEVVNVGDLQPPASSSSHILPKNSGNGEATCYSPSPSSPSADYRPPVSESPTPSKPSTSFASTAPERSSLTTIPASELSSSSLRKAAIGQEEIIYGSSSPSVDSRPTTSGSLTSSVTSLKSGSRLSPSYTVRSSLTTTSPSSSDKPGRKLMTNLKESPKVGSPSSSSSRGSADRPPRILRNSISPVKVDSSPPAPTNASRLAKRFITDLQARSVARRSTKGVRSIELRGGKAQSYSTTTVTSWNVTTTTVETSVSISEVITEKKSQNAAAGPNASVAHAKAIKEAPTTVKFAKNARSFEEVMHAEPETVALKHGEVAERRLSEEYMTNHALEGVVRQISENDRRVKVLVHAFETLATLTDSEALAIEEKTLNQHLAQESLSVTTIAV